MPTISILDAIAREEGHKTALFDTSFYEAYIDPVALNRLKSGIIKDVDNLSILSKKSSPLEDLKDDIRRIEPDLIAFTYVINHLDMQRDLLGPVKEEFPNIKIIAGGSQCILNPESSIAEPYIDMMCYGEGEVLFRELLRTIESGGDPKTIRGLWLKNEGGGIHKSQITKLTDINTVPIPSWDLFEPTQLFGLYDGHAHRMGHVEFSRGCPYSCTYCGQAFLREAFMAGGKAKFVRHKSPKVAVHEYKILKEKYDLEMFYFVDGTFSSMSTQALEELAHLYREEVGLPFIALVHPLTVTERKAELLSLMGCVHVTLGIESGDAEYRARIMKRKMSNQQIVAAVRNLRKNGIKVSTYNIIGMPGMDRDHILKTIDLNREAGADSSTITCFMPFPDDEMTKYLIKHGLLDPSDIKIILGGSEPAVDIEEMSFQEIQGLYNTFNLYIQLPRVMFPFIRLLEFSNPVTDFIRRWLYKALS